MLSIYSKTVSPDTKAQRSIITQGFTLCLGALVAACSPPQAVPDNRLAEFYKIDGAKRLHN